MCDIFVVVIIAFYMVGTYTKIEYAVRKTPATFIYTKTSISISGFFSSARETRGNISTKLLGS